MSFTASDQAAARAGGGQPAISVIDQHTALQGTITTDRDLRIEGRVSGAILCDGVLTISSGAEVDAEIDAADIIVSGTMSGKVRCRGRLEIRATGTVRGDVTTGSLIIVEGARYEGQIAMEATPVAGDATAATDSDAITLEDVEPAEPETYSFLRRFSPSAGGEDDTESDDDDAEERPT
jgi:cytoskeletal protein CcmA (bactofilin family)